MRGTPAWLLGLCIALILVGLVSHTPVRHLIQISPCILSLILLWRGYKWAPISALPLFAIWFVLMTLIWLFLLGIAKVLSGHFTPTEIALTIVIAICCLGGFAAALRDYKGRSIVTPLLVFIIFLGLQAGAVWLSMRPTFARM
jgi:hypothetical protein